MLRTTLACAFQHLNFQKCSEHGVFCAFWLRNVLRVPHRRALFSTSQLPKVVRTWCVLYILTCKCASRHNGVHFFISHPARWLRTRRFSEPTFRPSWAPKRWKNTVFRNCSTFSRTCIFFLLTLSLLWSSFFFSSLLWLFPPLLFHLSILSEVWLLNFLRILFNCLFISVHAKTAWPAGFVFSSFQHPHYLQLCCPQVIAGLFRFRMKKIWRLSSLLSRILPFYTFYGFRSCLRSDQTRRWQPALSAMSQSRKVRGPRRAFLLSGRRQFCTIIAAIYNYKILQYD